MSFTFKRMLSSLGRSESTKSEMIGRETTTTATTTTNGFSDSNQNHLDGNYRVPTSETNGLSCATDQKASQKRSLSKRGKKKLSAMISRLNTSIQHHGSKSKSTTEQSDCSNSVAPETDDTDEDDEFGEPLCQDGFDELSLDQQQGLSKLRSSSFVSKGSMERRCSTTQSNEIKDDEDDNKAGLMPEEDCDIPTFLYTKDCDKQLIETTRVLLKERFAKNPDNFYEADYKRMLEDDWTVSRFLLRRRLDPKRTAKLMEECGRFRKQYKMSEIQLWEFPIEFHKAGGLFKYAPDRVGNLTVYMRVKMYRRVPEISDVFKAFILCVLEQADVENQGRGVAVVFDLSGCGLQNVDLSFLSWLLSSFRNYCPKGVSYIVVYNLPWILSTTCRVAMTWMSATNRRALRFVHGDEIENFIAKENLPDYCGGTCKIDYRSVPEGSKKATEVCSQLDITREQALKIRELFKEYLSDDDDDDQDQDDLDDKGKKSKKKNKNKSKNKKQANQLDVKPKDSATIDCDTPKGPQEEQTRRENGHDSSMDNHHHNHLGPSADFVSQASKFIA